MPRPDFSIADTIIHEMIRVDHAGEYGAKRIYEGQLDSSLDYRTTSIIKHMLQQEESHLSYFTNLLLERKVRPTIFVPFWHLTGYLLGKSSAMIGPSTAMLVTQSIEEVIEEHYQKQISYLESSNIEKDLLSNIKQFQLDEIEHKDTASSLRSDEAICGGIMSGIIKYICVIAIKLSKVV